jgi:hypothetical protein
LTFGIGNARRQSARGLAHSKTLARVTEPKNRPPGFWTAPALALCARVSAIASVKQIVIFSARLRSFSILFYHIGLPDSVQVGAFIFRPVIFNILALLQSADNQEPKTQGIALLSLGLGSSSPSGWNSEFPEGQWRAS